MWHCRLRAEPTCCLSPQRIQEPGEAMFFLSPIAPSSSQVSPHLQGLHQAAAFALRPFPLVCGANSYSVASPLVTTFS